MTATETLTQMGYQRDKTEKHKYPHTNGVCVVGYRRQKQMSEKNMEDLEAEHERLATDVKRIVAAMLCGFEIETEAGVAADNMTEVEEEEGEGR